MSQQAVRDNISPTKLMDIRIPRKPKFRKNINKTFYKVTRSEISKKKTRRQHLPYNLVQCLQKNSISESGSTDTFVPRSVPRVNIIQNSSHRKKSRLKKPFVYKPRLLKCSDPNHPKNKHQNKKNNWLILAQERSQQRGGLRPLPATPAIKKRYKLYNAIQAAHEKFYEEKKINLSSK